MQVRCLFLASLTAPMPSKLIDFLGWKAGQDLDGQVKYGKLIFEKKKSKTINFYVIENTNLFG